LRSARGDLVVVLGACGAIGRMHTDIYRSLGIRMIELDIAMPALTSKELAQIPWSEAIVDVCTPTAAHTESVRWAYRYGARRFFVEKPVAGSYVEWRSCLLEASDALIFVGHSYMFSRAFEMVFETCPTPRSIRATFDKDRAADDLRLRGADQAGQLPDIFEIEVPHPLAMVLAIEPALQLVSANYTRLGERAPSAIAATSCEARLAHSRLTDVVVTSDLRAPRQRRLELRLDDAQRVVADFPLSGRSSVSYVYRIGPRRRVKTLYRGPDDLLRAVLTASLEALAEARVPWLASAQFAALAVARMVQARRLATTTSGSAASVGPRTSSSQEVIRGRSVCRC
jgi:predicted dehydrogenase